MMMILLLVVATLSSCGLVVQASSSSYSSSSSTPPPWRRRRRQWGGKQLLQTQQHQTKNNAPSFPFLTSFTTTSRIVVSSPSKENVDDDEDDEACLLLGLPSSSKATITRQNNSSPLCNHMLAGILGRFGDIRHFLPVASSASSVGIAAVVGVLLLLLIIRGGGWKLSPQWILLAHQQQPEELLLSKNIAMCQDQLPQVWKQEILSKLELVLQHNNEDKDKEDGEDHPNDDDHEEQILIHQALLENPALARTLRKRVQPFMRQRMRLLNQAQAILDRHHVHERRRRDNNHNKDKNSKRKNSIRLKDWKIWAEYHAEITVERYRFATQTLSERLETTTDSTVSRPHLVQGLTHRLILYCQAMDGGNGGDDDSSGAQGVVVLDDHVLRTFFKEALKDAILPLPQPNKDENHHVLQNTTTAATPTSLNALLQALWNRTRKWIDHIRMRMMKRFQNNNKRDV